MTRAPDFGDATFSTTTLDHWPAIYGPTPPGEEVASAAVEKSLAVKLNQAYIAWLRRAMSALRTVPEGGLAMPSGAQAAGRGLHVRKLSHPARQLIPVPGEPRTRSRRLTMRPLDETA